MAIFAGEPRDVRVPGALYQHSCLTLAFASRNYEQLGLKFRLFASEVLFNLGLSRIRMERMDKGLEYLEKAKSLTMIEDHDVIEDVIRHKGEGYTVFTIVRLSIIHIFSRLVTLGWIPCTPPSPLALKFNVPFYSRTPLTISLTHMFSRLLVSSTGRPTVS